MKVTTAALPLLRALGKAQQALSAFPFARVWHVSVWERAGLCVSACGQR